MKITVGICCPVCGNKTRLQIRADTELTNFPLYFQNSNYLGMERERKPVFYAGNKFLCYNSVDDWALTGMGFSRNNQETTVRLS